MNGLLNAARGHSRFQLRRAEHLLRRRLAGHRSLDIHGRRRCSIRRECCVSRSSGTYELRNGQQLETVASRQGADNRQERAHGPGYLSFRGRVLSQTMAEFTYTTPSRQHAAAPEFAQRRCSRRTGVAAVRRGKSVNHYELGRKRSKSLVGTCRLRRALCDSGDSISQPLHVDSQ